ncbi:MAG: bifunctional phosphoribosyl-AMP cyclohydrolase/phosphoribosyl-ATP diphosphatase HisIE [Dokdonella sp.]|uniref:bifunctional phosphoribosyl-AMP cyclohydrolase/phosphoribosyl-ATP diphosphatase HisIE n=3 Tax=Dokdonella sp. TaxID=2291710 RepID=UPI0025BB87F3|nr:bifunctional phosphoribosyl-AMP cyclohydrolase/phosphoribosyl-ATP diphosphatase HisIE [Dokdonella sp.]MBX3701184.1 bifunctional phosphoribosyl-AMP cyclohydrolase/phosphoribosyl-ATP diphosphatase HisIE [Dokdonella sp.]
MTADTDLAARLDWDKGDGLVPLIAQHAHDGRVLMLGYTNRAALARTLATRLLHFWSRSRQCLWRKGEHSGHGLELVTLAADCDGDTLLAQVLPHGPTCHRGTPTCFDGAAPAQPWLNELEALIARRAEADAATSYVARLLAAPAARRAQKVGEEGVEVALAAATGDRESLRSEAADLVFHLLVLLRGADLSLADVVGELARRHATR